MNKCTYHSLEPGGMTIAVLGTCQTCQASTSYPALIRCEKCSTNANKCMKCDDSLSYSEEHAYTALERLRKRQLRYDYLITDDNNKAFDALLQNLQDGKYPTLDQLRKDHSQLSANIEKQICDMMRKRLPPLTK